MLTDAQEHSVELKGNGSQECINRRQMKCNWYGNNEVEEQRLGPKGDTRGSCMGSAEIWRKNFQDF